MIPATSPWERSTSSERETLVLSPPCIHAKQHFRPVLGLGSTGTGLDIDKGIIGIGFATEHTPEFHFLEPGFDAPNFRIDLVNGFTHRLQLISANSRSSEVSRTSSFKLVQAAHNLFQAGPLLAQFLGLLRIIPDIRAFENQVNFFESFLLAIIVKDTPLALQFAG